MKVRASRIILPRLRIHARHGVDAQERMTGACFYVSLEADTDFSQAMLTDRIEETVSYADLYECIREEMAVSSNLLEHVAGRIVRRIFSAFPTVTHIKLTLTKENPPMGADCREAGVEVEVDR